MNLYTIYTVVKSVCRQALAVGIVAFAALSAAAQHYQPSPENLRAREEFNDMRFGVFIHWGIYSMFGQGEWYLQTGGLDRDEYAKAAAGFYPANFDAAKWVSAIKASGAKYICFTTRHHDGFSMFDTKYSDYDIMDATPFKRDIVKELADECHRQGIKLHLYYSHLDWTRDDYPLGRTGHKTGRKGSADWPGYYRFMNNQLTELLTNYGPIGAVWFDGHWDQPKDFDWQLEEQYALIHRLQPACLVGNNHHIAPYEGEDFQMFERDLPGENHAGYSGEQSVSKLPLETCQTMNGMWGYKVADRNYKSAKELIRLIVKTAGKGANLLLNVGPQPSGDLPATALSRLSEIGEWMGKYGETVYGTDRYLTDAQEWGTVVRKGKKLYVHILADRMPEFVAIPMADKVREAVTFDGGEKLKFETIDGGIVLHTSSLQPATDRIVTLLIK